MIGFLYLLATLAFLLNIDAPVGLSNTPSIILIIEYLGVLWIANLLVRNKLNAEKKEKSQFMAFFLLGLTVSFLFLYFVWTPNLPENSKDWGFDPQRYYQYATTIANGDIVLAGLNYFGIVYFYGFIFKLLGIDPLIPLFINCLLTLTAVIVVSNHFSKVGGLPKYFSLLLLIPELWYFNTMSSREIVCMFLATISIIQGYQVVVKERRGFRIIWPLACLVLLIIIRPPMGGGVFVSIMAFMLFNKKKGGNRILNFIYITGLVLVIVLGLSLTNKLGGDGGTTSSDLSEIVVGRISGDNSESSEFQYGSNSIAARLIPHNTLEFVVFGIIRSFAYLIIPPAVFFSPLEAFSINRPTTDCFANLTVIFMMAFIPIVFSKCFKKNKTNERLKIVCLSFLFLFFIIGMFNTNMIHQRYRVVYILLYFSIVAYHYSMKKNDLGQNSDISSNPVPHIIQKSSTK